MIKAIFQRGVAGEILRPSTAYTHPKGLLSFCGEVAHAEGGQKALERTVTPCELASMCEIQKPNEPHRHHYCPQFFTKRWAGADGKLCVFSRPHKAVISRRKRPVETGWVDSLYTIHVLPAEHREYIETQFFKRVDQDASDVLDLLEQEGPVALSKRHNDGLSRFVMSLMQRDPFQVARLKAIASKTYDGMIDDFRDRYEAQIGSEDETFDQFKAKIELHTKSLLGGVLIPRLSDLPKLGEHLNTMKRRVITLEGARFQFLTADRPLIRMVESFADPRAVVFLPIGPRKILVFANTQERMEAAERAFAVDKRMVPALNELSVKRAGAYVYAASDDQARFISNHWPEEPQDVFPSLARFL